MLFSWSGMNPEGVQDSSATYGSETRSGSARVSAENAFGRDASVTVARRDSVPGVGGAKRHRGGDAPSHVPSSRRRIPPRLLGSDTEARATPALESRDAGPAGRLVVRRRWRASVSRHPRPSAWRWRGNARDAIARALSFSPARSRERGSARVCTALASRTHCARTQSRELRARGQLCSKMRDATVGSQVSGGERRFEKTPIHTKFDRSRTRTRVSRTNDFSSRFRVWRFCPGWNRGRGDFFFAADVTLTRTDAMPPRSSLLAPEHGHGGPGVVPPAAAPAVVRVRLVDVKKRAV